MYFEKRVPVLMQLGLNESAVKPLKDYLDHLWSTNEEFNLISRKMTIEELIDNHIIDCLLPLNQFPKDVKIVADFGTGGGMPAILYAIQFPHIKFRLYEKSPKKQEFLNFCKKWAPNIEVFADIPLELINVDLVICRAFKPLDVILDMSRRFYDKQGKFFLLKGRREKIDEELLISDKKFKNLKVEVIPLKSPVLEVERHLVLINC